MWKSAEAKAASAEARLKELNELSARVEHLITTQKEKLAAVEAEVAVSETKLAEINSTIAELKGKF